MSLPALPIDDVLDECLEALRGSGGLVLRAPPGAGKTTRLAPAMLDAGLAGDRQILLLQPRRLATRAAAARISAERGAALGEETGYQVRFERRAGPRTRILAMTDGVFLRLLQDDPYLESVGAVLFDEFHERTLNADLGLAMARRVQSQARSDLKIVVMSATLIAGPVAEYLGGCPVIESQGRQYPVAIRHLAAASEMAWAERAVEGVRAAISETNGHMLVFLPGVGEIRRLAEVLAEYPPASECAIHELYGDLPLERQQAALAPSERRKIVLATNVAETSLTIDGVTGVVDTGTARVLRLDPATGINRLLVERISRAAADQRAGRAGRTAPGVCWRLWSPGAERGMAEFDDPEIVRADLSGPVLELLQWGERDLFEFPWFQPPSRMAIEQAVTLLARLGAIDAGAMTAVGREMVRLPLPPRLARMVIEANRHGAADAACLAAAMLSERDPFAGQRRSPRKRTTHASDSDVLDRVLALRDMAASRRRNSNAPGIDPGAVQGVMRIQRQLLRQVEELSPPEATLEEDEALGRGILAAFPDRLARRRAPGSPRARMVGGRGVRLSDESAVINHELFVCVELQEQGGAEALVRQASAVERHWLPAEHVSIRTEVEYDGERERVVAWRRTRFLDLTIEETQALLPADIDPAPLLIRAARERWPQGWPLDEGASQFLARARSLAGWMPELQLPDLGPGPIPDLLDVLVVGCTSLAELQSAPALPALLSKFSAEQLRQIERHAPQRLTVPSGSAITLSYDYGRPPVLAVRIQELFGLRETPRIAGGRVAVLLHLLGPNYRPQQITSDLASFWQNTYPEVRKELRRRYPKHAWPDDPLTATAERRVKRRGER